MEARQQRSKTLKKIMSLVGCVSFGGTTLFGIANTLKTALKEPQQVETAPVVSVEEQLQKTARGYESVLEQVRLEVGQVEE